eukprot:Gb_06936 [translate_table: standard]
MKLLLEEGEGWTTLDAANALHYVAAYCDSKITTELWDLDCADVNLRNARGYTVLHIATMRRELTTIVALLTKGARPLDLTSDEQTTLHISRRMTRVVNYYRRTEQGKESPKDRLCIEILEHVESMNALWPMYPFLLQVETKQPVRDAIAELEHEKEHGTGVVHAVEVVVDTIQSVKDKVVNE